MKKSLLLKILNIMQNKNKNNGQKLHVSYWYRSKLFVNKFKSLTSILIGGKSMRDHNTLRTGSKTDPQLIR